MLLIFQARSERSISRSTLLSAAAHATVLLVIVVLAHITPRIAPFKLPGTAKGATVLTYYSPGSQRHASSDVRKRLAVSKPVRPAVQEPAPKVESTMPAASNADPGQGTTPESSMGDGNINIALLQHFPIPKPDLSTLPVGTKGDVVLDAVIDEHGKITALTLLKGLGGAVDESVIATVKEWLFKPATKDGVPVVSEQELHFHYERG